MNMGIVDKYISPTKTKMVVFKSEITKNKKMILSDNEYK